MDEVKKDATSKSTLYLMDAECQLEGMRLAELSNPKAHIAELKSHFKLMMSRYKNPLEMGSSFVSRGSSCSLLLCYQIYTDLLSRPSLQLMEQLSTNCPVPNWRLLLNLLLQL